jgi:hypothetical protein
MLIAHAHNCFEHKVNYQQNVLFVGQDLDPAVAMMAFIQLTLLGCAGYIVAGNSLTNPVVGDALFPKTGKVNDNVPDAEIWYTPMFFHDTWNYRRLCRRIDTFTNLFEGSENHVDVENQETERPALCVLKSKG